MRFFRSTLFFLVFGSLATGLVILSVALFILRFGLNIPYWDQWEIVPLFARLEQGQGTLGWLLSQHNEHRPFFPRLLWYLLAKFTHYNVTAEMWLNFFIVLATFVVVVWYAQSVWKTNRVTPLLRVAACAVIALCVFNLVQWESWLFGFQTVMFLGMFCVVAGFVLLGRPLTWARFGLAAGLGISAIFSMGNALLYGPIGLGLVLLFAPSRMRIGMGALWCMIFSAASALYLYDWHSQSLVSLTNILPNSFLFARWLTFFLGSLFLNDRFSQYFGAASFAALIFFIVQARRKQLLKPLAPLWAVLAMLILSGMVISLGRAASDVYSGLAPRYVALTAWYWVSLIVLGTLLLSPRTLTIAAALIVPLLGITTLQGGLAGYNYRYLYILPTYETVRSGAVPTDEALVRLYGVDPSIVRTRLVILCDYGWSVCESQP